MMKYFYGLGALFCVVLLLLIGGISLAKADPLVDQVFNPTVQLGSFCSGAIIHSERAQKSGLVSTIVLTAKHCIEDADETIDINKARYDSHNRLVGKDVYTAEVFGTSYKSDLALLRLNDKQTLFENVGKVADKDTPLAFGQNVELIGYPLGLSMTYTTGKLGYVEKMRAFSDVSKTGEFYRATPDIAPGSSGSSMYTLVGNEYQIIGIVTGGATKYTFVNFFTPIEEINEYLDVAKKSWDWPETATKVDVNASNPNR